MSINSTVIFVAVDERSFRAAQRKGFTSSLPCALATRRLYHLKWNAMKSINISAAPYLHTIFPIVLSASIGPVISLSAINKSSLIWCTHNIICLTLLLKLCHLPVMPSLKRYSRCADTGMHAYQYKVPADQFTGQLNRSKNDYLTGVKQIKPNNNVSG